jgi:hypothetical protein
MKRVLNSIQQLLTLAEKEDRNFPPTLLFEEGWMLRLVLRWFAESTIAGHDLSFAPNARWFSEARLASAFLPRRRGDEYAEGHTHADGVVGHFQVGRTGRSNIALDSDAQQFIVIEAKMFSGLSRGTTRARTYNQAARSVACMAELVSRIERDPSRIACMAFLILAPEEQLAAGNFRECIDKVSLAAVVRQRVTDYDAPKTEWFEKWFVPTLASMRVNCLSWESVVEFIKSADPHSAVTLRRSTIAVLVSTAFSAWLSAACRLL